jgi:hypothetical protein
MYDENEVDGRDDLLAIQVSQLTAEQSQNTLYT